MTQEKELKELQTLASYYGLTVEIIQEGDYAGMYAIVNDKKEDISFGSFLHCLGCLSGYRFGYAAGFEAHKAQTHTTISTR